MAAHKPPWLAAWDDIKPPPSHRQQTSSVIKYRRRHPHPFTPNPGWPNLCGACNAEKDETFRGQYIHTTHTC